MIFSSLAKSEDSQHSLHRGKLVLKMFTATGSVSNVGAHFVQTSIKDKLETREVSFFIKKFQEQEALKN